MEIMAVNAVLVLLFGLAWLVSLATYRLFFHPLSRIPGPKLAAVTHFYIPYFYFTGGSKLFLQIEKLHQEFGPVVRISPDEVHLSDSDNYDKIYFQGSKYTKPLLFYSAFGFRDTMFVAPSNELHRIRRSAINPLFSRKRVLDLEDVIRSKVAIIDLRLKAAAQSKSALDLHHGLRAISVDTFTEYAFGKSFGLLDQEDFGIPYFDSMFDMVTLIWVFQALPFVLGFARSIPRWLAKRLSTSLRSFMLLQEECRDQIVSIKAKQDASEQPPSHITIFHQLMNPKAAEGHVVPKIDTLTDESLGMLQAASDTTGMAMATAISGVLNDKDIHSTLSAELCAAFPDATTKLTFIQLEKLPYLTAVIKEGLRLSYGAIGRLPRVVPSGGAVFNGILIPGGYNVGMSAWMMHRDPEHFPDPDRFDPERWMDPVAARQLDKYFVAFSKGQRNCIGMQLAYAEIYLTVGTIFRRHPHLKALPLRSEDLELQDYFAPRYPRHARKFHVITE